MKSPITSPVRAVRLGDVLIAALLLAIFTFSFVYAQQWPFRARLFPELLSAAGIAFSVFKLVGFGIQMRRHRSWTRQTATGRSATGEGEQGGDDSGKEHSIEYVFGTAGGRAWAAALGWVTAFFVALWLVGVYVTVPLFAFVYLKVAGRTSWLGAVIYAAVAGGILWFVFGQLLVVPMPAGII